MPGLHPHDRGPVGLAAIGKNATGLIGLVDCSHNVKHAGRHRPHPVTGRLVCQVCHPIPARVEQAAPTTTPKRRRKK